MQSLEMQEISTKIDLNAGTSTLVATRCGYTLAKLLKNPDSMPGARPRAEWLAVWSR